MAPPERRQAIVAALVPLLVERGGELSTKEIAKAAGVAEGTIFGVFKDKRELMLAAAQEAIDPAGGRRSLDELLNSDASLREQITAVTRELQDRMQVTMTVMLAVRAALAPESDAPTGKHPPGPPDFLRTAQERLDERLVALFQTRRKELTVSPELAALALRSMIFGSAARPYLGPSPTLDAEQIAELVLDGIGRRSD